MPDPNTDMLRRVAEALRNLDVTVVYVGGATIALYLDEYAASQLRVTLDVDCVVPISTLPEHQELEAQLRELGFRHCLDDDAPICRWNYEDLIVDIMPYDSSVLGFGNRFSRLGFASSEERSIAPGLQIRTLAPRYLFASKVEAFKTRGVMAPYESKDLEDIVALLDGATGIVEAIESADDEVLAYVGDWASTFLREARSNDLVEGHTPRGPMFEQRIERVLQKLRQLAKHDGSK